MDNFSRLDNAIASGADLQFAVRTARNDVTWSKLAELYHDAIDRLQPWQAARVGFTPSADANAIAVLAALQHLQCDTFLLDQTWTDARRSQIVNQLNLSVTVDHRGEVVGSIQDVMYETKRRGSLGDPSVGGPRDSTLTILTSGTTGEPKAVCHTWQSLGRPVRPQTHDLPPVWLLAFRPHLYAGLQVILQAMLNHGTLVMAPPSESPASIVSLMRRAHVEFASATPSYWRRLLMLVPEDEIQKIPLRQITLGGEVADQPLLDRLSSLFPHARVIHIYATTEMGRCFSIHDKQAGFPATLLEQPTSDGVELKIVDRQLWVRSANAMRGYDGQGAPAEDRREEHEGWFATKDLVEIVGDRVLFVGRDSDMINVGGNKVHPGPVERLIRGLPEVADVQIYSVSSSVAGQLVACKAVAAPGVDADVARKRILAACQQQLERYQCPRMVEMVESLELTSAGKIKRSDG